MSMLRLVRLARSIQGSWRRVLFPHLKDALLEAAGRRRRRWRPPPRG